MEKNLSNYTVLTEVHIKENYFEKGSSGNKLM